MADKAEVTIEVTGLALFFLKETVAGQGEVWNVAFLCDDNHALDFYIDGESQDGWRPQGQDIIVEIADSSPAPCRKGNFQKLLNLSHPTYGHGAKNQNTSNLTIRRRKDITDLVWMRVPYSKMEVEKSEDTMIVQTQPDFGVPKRIADCGKKVKLKFDVEGNFSLVLKDMDGVELPDYSPIDIQVDPEEDDDITLTFNNECGGCGRNDFIDLYEFVYHENDDGDEVQFMSWAEDAESEVIFMSDAAGRSQNRLESRREEGWVVTEERENELVLQKQEFLERFRAGRTSPYGNCDPVGSEPPPGP